MYEPVQREKGALLRVLRVGHFKTLDMLGSSRSSSSSSSSVSSSNDNSNGNGNVDHTNSTS